MLPVPQRIMDAHRQKLCSFAGIHVLDVTDRSFRHVPGIEQRLAQRQAEMDASLESIARVPSRVQMAMQHVTVPQDQLMHRIV